MNSLDIRSYAVTRAQAQDSAASPDEHVELNKVTLDSALKGHRFNQYLVLLNVANAFKVPFADIKDKWDEFRFDPSD